MHLSGIGSNVQTFLLRIHCALTAAPTESLFQALFTSIYMPFTWAKKPPLCFYSIDYMLPVDFRHKSHFFVDMKCHGKADGVRTERLRDFWANDAFGRLLRSIIPNDDWHRCNKSRIFKDFISKWMDACSVSGKICEEQREQQFLTASLLTLFQSGVRQINDILTDIFSTSEVR